MLQCSNTIMTWTRILLTQKIEEPKCNKGNFTPLLLPLPRPADTDIQRVNAIEL